MNWKIVLIIFILAMIAIFIGNEELASILGNVLVCYALFSGFNKGKNWITEKLKKKDIIREGDEEE